MAYATVLKVGAAVSGALSLLAAAYVTGPVLSAARATRVQQLVVHGFAPATTREVTLLEAWHIALTEGHKWDPAAAVVEMRSRSTTGIGPFIRTSFSHRVPQRGGQTAPRTSEAEPIGFSDYRPARLANDVVTRGSWRSFKSAEHMYRRGFSRPATPR